MWLKLWSICYDNTALWVMWVVRIVSIVWFVRRVRVTWFVWRVLSHVIWANGRRLLRASRWCVLTTCTPDTLLPDCVHCVHMSRTDKQTDRQTDRSKQCGMSVLNDSEMNRANSNIYKDKQTDTDRHIDRQTGVNSAGCQFLMIARWIGQTQTYIKTSRQIQTDR